MPALDPLSSMTPGEAAEQSALLPASGAISMSMPLVRVVVPNNDRGPAEILDVFAHGILRKAHKSAHSRKLELDLGTADSLYFHAGRTHPQYGLAVIVIQDCPKPVEVTPFGLGGLCCSNQDANPLHAA